MKKKQLQKSISGKATKIPRQKVEKKNEEKKIQHLCFWPIFAHFVVSLSYELDSVNLIKQKFVTPIIE